MRCPTCQRAFAREESRFAPFCSERCKLLDLGRWLDGSYAIPADEATPADLAREEEAKKN